MNPKITVIMPSLNVGKYIDKCIVSVVEQSLKDIEILCVDAGSTDGTLEILNSYAEKDSRVKVIHSEKRSYGYQMNLGISMAQGEYISIVETDDFIEPDMLEVLYDYAKQKDADYVKGTAVQVYELDDHVLETESIIPYNGIATLAKGEIYETVPRETPTLFVPDNFLWNGIYKTNFMRNISFRETPGAAFQDVSVLFRIISTAKSAVYINKKVYYYRQDNMGASSYNKKSMGYTEDEYEYIIQNYLEGVSSGWKKIAYKKMILLMLNRFDVMASSGSYWDEALEAIEKIKEKIKFAFDEKILCGRDFEENQYYRLRLLFVDSMQSHEILSGFRQDRAEEIVEMMRFLDGQEAIVFGSGPIGKYVTDLLRIHYGCKIKAYWDNAEKKHGQIKDGIPICKPECAKEGDKIILAVRARHRSAIMKQLLELGYKESDIYVCETEHMDGRLYWPNVFMK